jgi:hypothetical protein
MLREDGKMMSDTTATATTATTATIATIVTTAVALAVRM